MLIYRASALGLRPPGPAPPGGALGRTPMTTETMPQADQPTSRVRQVATDRPWVWLTAGWRDMLATKPVALAYGGAVCLAGWVVSLLLFELGTLWAILPATSGFFLIGPLVAAGLYEASRLREQGRQPTLADLLAPFRRNGWQIAFIGLALLMHPPVLGPHRRADLHAVLRPRRHPQPGAAALCDAEIRPVAALPGHRHRLRLRPRRGQLRRLGGVHPHAGGPRHLGAGGDHGQHPGGDREFGGRCCSGPG